MAGEGDFSQSESSEKQRNIARKLAGPRLINLYAVF